MPETVHYFFGTALSVAPLAVIYARTSVSRGNVYVLCDVVTFNPKHSQIWPIFLHILEESFSFGQRFTVRIFKPREKVLFTNSEGRNIKIQARIEEFLQPWFCMESHFKLQNESWLHSVRRLILFQMSETVPQLENTLLVLMHEFFSSVLLRDFSILSVRVYIKTH